MIFIVDQVYIFLYAILGGAIVAFFYDILRIKRRAVKTNVIIVGLEDILYWLVAAVFLFITVYKSNNGEMRGFIFIGNMIGVILYETLLSKIIINSSIIVINIIKRILLFIWKLLSYPFKLIFKLLYIPISFISKLIFKLAKKCLHKAKRISRKTSGFTKNRIKKLYCFDKKKRKVQKNA